MTTNVKEMLERLLYLSRRQIEFTMEEDWDGWDKVASEKESIIFDMKRQGVILRPDSSVVGEIRELDKRVIEIIRQKRDKTREQLSRVRQNKDVLDRYRKAGAKISPYHLGISC